MNKNKLTKILCLTAVLFSASQLDAGRRFTQHQGGGGDGHVDPVRSSAPTHFEPAVVQEPLASTTPGVHPDPELVLISPEQLQKIESTLTGLEYLKTVLADSNADKDEKISELEQKKIQLDQEISKLKSELETAEKLVASSGEENEKVVSDLREKLEAAEKLVASSGEENEKVVLDLREKLEAAEKLVASSGEKNEKVVLDLREKLEAANTERKNMAAEFEENIRVLTEKVAEKDAQLRGASVTKAFISNLESAYKQSQTSIKEIMEQARARKATQNNLN